MTIPGSSGSQRGSANRSHRTVAIIQARMGSTRFPGKVLADIGGRPMLWHVVNRARGAKEVEHTLVATSTTASDDPIAEFCREEGIPVFRGSEEDVLDRFYRAALQAGADDIVRITADCPLLDSGVMGQVIRRFLAGGYDYVSNVHPPSYPDGLDVEVFSLSALERAWTEAQWRSEREHVTSYIWKNSEIFCLSNVEHTRDLSGLRWTVDTRRDLDFVRSVYQHLGSSAGSMDDVLQVLERYPQMSTINEDSRRNEGYDRSLLEDERIRGV